MSGNFCTTNKFKKQDRPCWLYTDSVILLASQLSCLIYQPLFRIKTQNTGSHALLGKSLALSPSFVNSVRTYEMCHYHFQTGNCTIRSHCDASKVFHRQIHLLPWACQLTNKQMVIDLQISLQTVMLRRSRWVARGIFYSTLQRNQLFV